MQDKCAKTSSQSPSHSSVSRKSVMFPHQESSSVRSSVDRHNDSPQLVSTSTHATAKSVVPPHSQVRFQAGQKGNDPQRTHKKKADADDAVFAKNIASQGGFYDDYVLQFPDFYPDGTQEFNICKVVGKEGKTPTPAWAHVTNHSVSRCFGVFQCPHFGKSVKTKTNTSDDDDDDSATEEPAIEESRTCYTRERPRIPRRGNNRPKETYVDESRFTLSISAELSFIPHLPIQQKAEKLLDHSRENVQCMIQT